MTTPKPSRRWIWFFAVVGLLAVAGITINLVYNIRQQLTPEQLRQARERWEETGPRSYNLRYLVRKPDTEPEQYEAEVRNGRVVAARLNGRLLEVRLWGHHDMRGRYADIQRFLEEDAKPGKPRVFAKAQFDAKTGQLLHYVRAVSATRERVQIDVQELTPITEVKENGREVP